MKVKQTLVCKRKYEVSTVKITGNLYETAVFPVSKYKPSPSLLLPNIYEVDYGKDLFKIQHTGWWNARRIHRIVCKYWDLRDINLCEFFDSNPHRRASN